MFDCYPVTPTVLVPSPQGLIRGLDNPSASDSDEGNDPVMPPTKRSAVPTPFQVVTAPPAYNKPAVPEPVHYVIFVQELPPVPTDIVPATCIPDPSPVTFAAPPQPPESAVAIPPRRPGRFGTIQTGYVFVHFYRNVSSNAITFLPEGIFKNLTKLHKFDISGNKITSLHDDVFIGMKSPNSL
ncbi:hypothetical protein ACROYT_G004888 [Oculina patagonica]